MCMHLSYNNTCELKDSEGEEDVRCPMVEDDWIGIKCPINYNDKDDSKKKDENEN